MSTVQGLSFVITLPLVSAAERKQANLENIDIMCFKNYFILHMACRCSLVDSSSGGVDDQRAA